MVEFEWKHPDVPAEFWKGNFVVPKSKRKFLLIPKDHSHEQTTKTLKGTSGVVNIFDYPDTKDEHVVSLPEKLKVVADFETEIDIMSVATSSFFHDHHE